MVSKVINSEEGSDFDTEYTTPVNNSVSDSGRKDAWPVMDKHSHSVSSKPSEFHDDPGNPSQLRRAFNQEEMDALGSSQTDLTVFAVLFTAAQIVGIICIVLVWIWTGQYLGGFAWSSNPVLQFNYHPLFMVIGMVFLYGDAILVYRVLRSSRKTTLKIFHGCLHLLVFIFMVTALKAVFDYHNHSNIPNLYTLHSWMGITTVVLFGLQYVFGFVSFLYPGLTKTMRITMLPFHVFTGLLIFIMGVGCCITGITAKLIWTLKLDYGELVAPAVLVNCLGLCIVIFAIIVVFLVTSSRFKRQPLPEEAMLQLEPQSPAY